MRLRPLWVRGQWQCCYGSFLSIIIETGTTAGYFPANVEDYYRSIFFDALDNINQCISSRFDQPGFQTYSKLEAVLLKGTAGECYDDELAVVMQLYSEDLEEQLLRSQLFLLKPHFKNSSPPGLMDVANFVAVVLGGSQTLVLVLVAPARNATSERCFSALCIVKTSLRSTMGQPRLNHLLILHAHKVITLALNNVNNIFGSLSS